MTLLMAMYSDAGAARLTVSSGDWLAVLAAVHGQSYGKIIAAPGQLLADTMSNFDVSFQGKTMRLESTNKRLASSCAARTAAAIFSPLWA